MRNEWFGGYASGVLPRLQKGKKMDYAWYPLRWLYACTPFGARAALDHPTMVEKLVDTYDSPEEAREAFVESVQAAEERLQELEDVRKRVLRMAQKETGQNRSMLARQAMEYTDRIKKQNERLMVLYGIRAQLGIISDGAAIPEAMVAATALAKHSNKTLSPELLAALDSEMNDALGEATEAAKAVSVPFDASSMPGTGINPDVNLEAELAMMLNEAGLVGEPDASDEASDTVQFDQYHNSGFGDGRVASAVIPPSSRSATRQVPVNSGGRRSRKAEKLH